MKVKCDRCRELFETDGLGSGSGDEKYICPKCQFDSAVSEGPGQAPEKTKRPGVSPLQAFLSLNLPDILRNPAIVLLALIGGLWLGWFHPGPAMLLGPVGNGYLALLRMCVFPIMITGIITSVGRLFVAHIAGKLAWRIISVFLILLFLAGLTGLAAGGLGKPGLDLPRKDRATLGRMLTESDKKAGIEPGFEINDGNSGVFYQTREKNLGFGSLSLGLSVEILFFALILGIATGFLPEIEGRLILSFSSSLFKAFSDIVNWLLYLLPVGVFCLISGRMAAANPKILTAMTSFVATVYLACLFFFILSSLLIRLGARVSWRTMIRHLGESLLVGLGTQNVFAALPSEMSGLKRIGVHPDITDLATPIGAVVCRFGPMVVFTVAAVFGTQLYGVHPGWAGLGLILVTSLAASLAGAGLPTLVSLSMISIVLDPLDLPAGPMLALLPAVYPLIEPAAALTGVQANLAAVCLVARGIKPNEEYDTASGDPEKN